MSTDDEGSEGVNDDAGGRPADKENLSPNRLDPLASRDGTPGKGSAGGVRGRKGRKRKRQSSQGMSREARDIAAARRLRIRQYYNGSTHSSASAVQLFAMAMQVVGK